MGVPYVSIHCPFREHLRFSRLVEETRREDQELIGRVASGDRDALAALYDRHSGTMMAIGLKILRDAGEAEDVLHDVFLEAWDRAGPVKRVALRAERTLIGHLTVGVVRGSLSYIVSDLRATLHNRRIRLIWMRHVAAVAVVIAVVVFSGMPLVQYAIGAVYGRVFFTGLRTFAEHRGVPEGTRSAVIHARRPLSLIFLNNNLHHTHHARPGAAWYRLPQLHDELGSAELARQGAGLYSGGYLEVARRYAVRPFCQPVHPTPA